jgi:hypothetical protein
MTYRLKAAPLTQDDLWIRVRVTLKFGQQTGFHALDLLALAGDRRDADLMLYAQQTSLGYVIRNTQLEEPNSLIWVRAPQPL